jgi:hypothetical protein
MSDTASTAAKGSAPESAKETLGFQAEVKQLLQLMIHSLPPTSCALRRWKTRPFMVMRPT